MHTVQVALADRSYPIYIGEGILAHAELLTRHLPQRRAALITDTVVAPIYLAPLADTLKSAGIEVVAVPPDGDHRPDMELALKALGTRGLTRILVEGGGHLAAALLRDNLVDRLHWFRAPLLMGGDGVPVAVALGVDALADAKQFVRQSIGALAEDGVETYIRRD